MKAAKLTGIVLALGMLSACTLDEPTWVNPSRVEVHEEGFTDSFDTGALDDATLRAIGVNYYRYGNGPMDIAVGYDPASDTNTRARAEGEGARIQSALARQGVRDMRVTATPVERAGEISRARISFPALTARAPEDCSMMPGITDMQTKVGGSATGPAKDYRIGCSIESLMARQVTRPGDLLGRPGFETNADARRQEAVVWQRGYYGNAAFPRLEGERASDDD